MAFEQEAEDATADQFVADLRSLEQPAPEGQRTPAQADAALNAAYGKLGHLLPATEAGPSSDYGTVSFAGVRESERSWLQLRDHWMAFLAVAYPAYPSPAFHARLTTQRTRQQQSIVQ